MTYSLVKPSAKILPSFLSALDEGKFIAMQLGHGDWAKEKIVADPNGYITLLNDPAPFTITRNEQHYSITEHELLWITRNGTDEFLGTIAMRYAGNDELIKVYAWHIGMAIRPGLLNKGYGIRSIAVCMDEIRTRSMERGLTFLVATCNETNTASSRLMQHFGFQFEERYEDKLFGGYGLRYKLVF
ncbi:MAG: GNAT family N-acetyltransferase [Candidatus Obscuribacterales bacterium]|jgi:predicted acetyltransferase|nr:GNAT family N-acetyltransferase [Candidatus Obscuribacterales bacterium]